MRRFLVAILVLSIVVILALWGVVAYRNHLSYSNGRVDARATQLIKVNVGSLTREIGWNAFWNPSFYAEGESDDVRERNSIASTGLSTAANVFLFQLGDNFVWSNTTFGVLRVSETDVFEQFLKTELGLNMGVDDAGRYGKNQYLTVRYDDRQAVFAVRGFVQQQEQADAGDTLLMAQLAAYMNGTHLIGIKESAFSDILGQSGHIVTAGREQVSVDFLEGEISFSYTRDGFSTVSGASDVPIVSDTSFAQININMMDWLPDGKVFSIGNYTLHGDSLMHYSAGQVIGAWKGMSTQMDSVLAWEYDENFEMHEVVETVERATPDFYLSIRTETDGLQQYLKRQGVLDSTSTVVNSTFFPLFQVFWQQEDGWLTLHTQTEAATLEQMDMGPSLYVEADIQAIKQHVSMPKIHRYIAPFRTVVLKTEEVPDGTLLHGHIKMEENTVNSLMQILVYSEETSK